MIIGTIASIPITVIKFQLKLMWNVILLPFTIINIFLQLFYFKFRKTAKYLNYFPFGFGMPSPKKNFPINSLSKEIWFDVLAFVKFHEAPNLFLVNLDLLPICQQEYFFSGKAEKKRRKVRDLLMIRSLRDELLIYDLRHLCKTLPVPEIDPPNVFKSFGDIVVGNDCQKQAIKIMIKFRALISDEHRIQCCLLYFRIINITNKREFNWMEQCQLLRLIASNILIQIAGIFSKQVIAKFNGCFPIPFKNKKNLCELEIPNAREIYELLIADIGKHNELRPFQVFHYDKKKDPKIVMPNCRSF